VFYFLTDVTIIEGFLRILNKFRFVITRSSKTVYSGIVQLRHVKLNCI
jgi:hypothetical protein